MMKGRQEKERTEAAPHTAGHHTLRKIHRIRDGEDNKLGASECGPVEEVVYDILLRCHQLVELIHQHHTAC